MDALVVVMRRQISLRRWQPSCILGVRDTTILRAQCVEERKQRFSGKTFAELKKEEEDRERIEAEKEEQESPKQKIEDELKVVHQTLKKSMMDEKLIGVRFCADTGENGLFGCIWTSSTGHYINDVCMAAASSCQRTRRGTCFLCNQSESRRPLFLCALLRAA